MRLKLKVPPLTASDEFALWPALGGLAAQRGSAGGGSAGSSAGQISASARQNVSEFLLVSVKMVDLEICVFFFFSFLGLTFDSVPGRCSTESQS